MALFQKQWVGQFYSALMTVLRSTSPYFSQWQDSQRSKFPSRSLQQDHHDFAPISQKGQEKAEVKTALGPEYLDLSLLGQFIKRSLNFLNSKWASFLGAFFFSLFIKTTWVFLIKRTSALLRDKQEGGGITGKWTGSTLWDAVCAWLMDVGH